MFEGLIAVYNGLYFKIIKQCSHTLKIDKRNKNNISNIYPSAYNNFIFYVSTYNDYYLQGLLTFNPRVYSHKENNFFWFPMSLYIQKKKHTGVQLDNYLQKQQISIITRENGVYWELCGPKIYDNWFLYLLKSDHIKRATWRPSTSHL
jgi:hypothetical protein